MSNSNAPSKDPNRDSRRRSGVHNRENDLLEMNKRGALGDRMETDDYGHSGGDRSMSPSHNTNSRLTANTYG